MPVATRWSKLISEHDVHLFHFVESAEQAWELLQRELGLAGPADGD